MNKAHRVPPCHDVEGDDTAERVGDDGHLSFLCKFWVALTEEHVESVQLIGQTPGDLRMQVQTAWNKQVWHFICALEKIGTECVSVYEWDI